MVLYGMLGIIGAGILIFLLTPAGKWWLDKIS